MERRPTGVVVAAIALGFVSLVLLGFAAVMAVSMALVKNAPPPASAAPGMVAPTTAMMTGAAAFMAGLLLLAAVWGIATMVGLLKLKPWARISVMVLGGFVTAAALLFALGAAMVPVMLKSTPLPPNANMAQMHVVLAAMGGMSLRVAGVGVWWLVYFALAGTRKAFASTTPVAVAPVRVMQPNPMTDFTFAQPLTPEERDEEEPKDPGVL
ncbi:MAG: hypothetical protein V4555_05415 [Acidobacteriota bacterium]